MRLSVRPRGHDGVLIGACNPIFCDGVCRPARPPDACRCTTSPLHGAPTYLHQWGLTGRSACSTSDLLNTRISFTRTSPPRRCCGCVGTSRTTTTWQYVPPPPQKKALQHSSTPALQHSSTPTLQHSNTPTHFGLLAHLHALPLPVRHLLQTIKMDESAVYVLDIRSPVDPVAKLTNHQASVNGIAWAPHSACHLYGNFDDHFGPSPSYSTCHAYRMLIGACKSDVPISCQFTT